MAGVEYVTPPTYSEESVTSTNWYDECLWKAFTWDIGDDYEYRDDLDEISPADGLNLP